MAGIYGDRDFETPTYQTATILSKCTKKQLIHLSRVKTLVFEKEHLN